MKGNLNNKYFTALSFILLILILVYNLKWHSSINISQFWWSTWIFPNSTGPWSRLQNGRENPANWVLLCVIFHAFVFLWRLFSKFTFSKDSFRNTIRVSNGLESDHDLIWVQTVCKVCQQTTKVAEYFYVSFFMLLFSSEDFFQNLLFQKILSGTLSECQMVWNQIMTWSGSKLFAKSVSRQQKLPLARKEFRVIYKVHAPNGQFIQLTC